MDLQLLNLDTGRERDIKQFFTLLLCEAIETAQNKLKTPPPELTGDIGNKAMEYWENEIRESYSAILDDALYDFRYQKQAVIISQCIDNEKALIHWIWSQDFFTFETDDGGDALPDESIEKYLDRAGLTSAQMDKVLKIIHREEA